MQAQPTKGRSLFGVCLLRGILVAAPATALIVALFPNSSAKSSSSINQVLRESVAEKKIPGFVAMVYMADHVTFNGRRENVTRSRTSRLPRTQFSASLP